MRMHFLIFVELYIKPGTNTNCHIVFILLKAWDGLHLMKIFFCGGGRGLLEYEE